MATPIVRKKRNFKALALDVSQPPAPPPAQPAPTRPAPGTKKRPPPMTLAAAATKTNGTNHSVDTDGNLLAVNAPNSAPATGTVSSQRMNYHSTLSSTLANLDLNSENKYHDLRNEDLKDMQELGQGNGGSVKKVEHVPTGTIMAKKVRVSLILSVATPCDDCIITVPTSILILISCHLI